MSFYEIFLNDWEIFIIFLQYLKYYIKYYSCFCNDVIIIKR